MKLSKYYRKEHVGEDCYSVESKGANIRGQTSSNRFRKILSR